MIKAAGQAKLLVWILGVVMTVLTLSISPHLPDWLGAETAIRRDAALYFGIICAPMLFRVSGIIFPLSCVPREIPKRRCGFIWG